MAEWINDGLFRDLHQSESFLCIVNMDSFKVTVELPLLLAFFSFILTGKFHLVDISYNLCSYDNIISRYSEKEILTLILNHRKILYSMYF